VTPNEPWVQVIQQPTAKGMIHVLYNTKTAAGTEDVRLPTAAGTVALKTRNRWPALAAGSREGALVVVNALKVTVGKEPVMSASGLTAVLSLDGRDLRQSEAMLVAPFDQGRVELGRRSGQFVAVVGEFRAGNWTVLEQLPSDQGRLALELDQDRSTCVILVCRQGQQEKWGASLTQAMLRPEEFVGDWRPAVVFWGPGCSCTNPIRAGACRPVSGRYGPARSNNRAFRRPVVLRWRPRRGHARRQC